MFILFISFGQKLDKLWERKRLRDFLIYITFLNKYQTFFWPSSKPGVNFFSLIYLSADFFLQKNPSFDHNNYPKELFPFPALSSTSPQPLSPDPAMANLQLKII